MRDIRRKVREIIYDENPTRILWGGVEPVNFRHTPTLNSLTLPGFNCTMRDNFTV